MTREEILNMSAGREMDALVAKYVLFSDKDKGIEVVDVDYDVIVVKDAGLIDQHRIEHYSTKEDAAIEVIDELLSRGKWNRATDLLLEEIQDFSPASFCKAALLVFMEL